MIKLESQHYKYENITYQFIQKCMISFIKQLLMLLTRVAIKTVRALDTYLSDIMKKHIQL